MFNWILKHAVALMTCPETGFALKFVSGFDWNMVSPDREHSNLDGDSIGQEWWIRSHIWQRYYYNIF